MPAPDADQGPPTAPPLRARIEADVGSDGSFTILMGDMIEPRRQFIKQNALNVKNLDV